MGVGAWRGALTGAAISSILTLVAVVGGVATHDILGGLAVGAIVLGIGASTGAATGALVGGIIGVLPRGWRQPPTSAFGVVFVLTFALGITLMLRSDGYWRELHFETVGSIALLAFVLGLIAGVATSGLEAG